MDRYKISATLLFLSCYSTTGSGIATLRYRNQDAQRLYRTPRECNKYGGSSLRVTDVSALTTKLPACDGEVAQIHLPIFQSHSFHYININGTKGRTQHCNWLFTVKEPGYTILFRLANMYVKCEEGDILTVYDGPNNSSKTLRSKVCIGEGGTLILSRTSGRNVYVTFKTSNATNREKVEFTLDMIAGKDMADESASCQPGGQVLQASTSVQYITSPNFPKVYKSDAFCQWNITSVATSPNISIQITYMDVDEYKSKCYGHIYFMRGTPEEREYCGGIYFSNFQFYVNEITVPIQFVTKDAMEKSGFVLSFQEIEQQTVPTTTEKTSIEEETDKVEKNETNNMQLILVIVIISVAVILIIFVIIIICIRRKRQNSSQEGNIQYNHESEKLTVT